MAFTKKGGTSYDPNLDVELSRKEIEIGEAKLVLSVHSYNNGEKKLGLAKVTKSKDGKDFSKVWCRLKKEEVAALHKAIPEVYKNL